MSVHRFTIDVQIDDEALAEHVAEHGGETPPYSTDPSEWDASDIFRAAEQSIVEPDGSEIAWYDGEQAAKS